MKFTALIEIGFDKNGEADFRVLPHHLENLSLEKMNELRAMVPVAIAQSEHWFMQGIEKRHPTASTIQEKR